MKNRIARSMPRYAGWKGKVTGSPRWALRYSAMIFTVTSPFAGRCWTNPTRIRLYMDRNGVVKTAVHKRWTGKRHEIDTYRYVTAILIMTNSYWRKSLTVVKAVASI